MDDGAIDTGLVLVQDTIILSAVVAVCTLFILVYWWNK